jgi:hypothetical protein
MDVHKHDKLKGMKHYHEKIVYIVMFQDGHFIQDKITKICSSF